MSKATIRPVLRRAALAAALATALPGDAAPLGAQARPRPDSLRLTGPSAGAARIEGRVRIGRALGARRPRFRIYGEGAGAVAPRAPEESPLRNVVVYLEGLPRTAAPLGAHPRATVEQRAERFSPHVLPVVAGTSVAFPNEDAIFHNVFSLSEPRVFDLGRYAKGESKSVRFDRTGVVKVFCHIHSDMSAVVLVLDTPAYTVPDADGRYLFEGVPAGDYTLVAWHERAEPVRRRVRVGAGGTIVEHLDIPIIEDARRE